ncbi:MAG TPA: hypothetical protein VJP77_01865 [Planctomycetota bacterium]|nr:hypothetical protein [Planctomycetota bacterium]
MPSTPLAPGVLACAPVLAFALAFPAPAQSILPLVPFEHTQDVYVLDRDLNTVFRLADLDLDGDFDGPLERTPYYSDNLGLYSIVIANGIAVGPNGVVYVSDSNSNRIVALLDRDGNGSCHGPHEAWLYFDGVSGSGLGFELGDLVHMSADDDGNVWAAVSGDSGSDTSFLDLVLRLRDGNADRDALDADEAHVYYSLPQTFNGDARAEDVQIGPDGHVYLLDVPPNFEDLKGIYRLDDADGSGAIDQPGEVAPFFLLPAQQASKFVRGFTVDRDGTFTLADTLNDVVWRARDDDGDGVVDPATEAVAWWTPGIGSTHIWKVAAAADGSVWACEDQTPNRILRFVDADGSGAIEADEVQAVYSDPPVPFQSSMPRSLAHDRQPTLRADAPPQVGQDWTLELLATAGDMAIVAWSGGTVAPIPLLPYGYLELDLTPGQWGRKVFGVVPEFAPLTNTLPVPDEPSLAGASITLQGLVGKPARLRLTNASTFVVAP